MEKGFDTYEYVKQLGEDLVTAFERSGKYGNHPVEIGTRKEESVIKKLEQILPDGIGIGSGFVIDSYGGISKQCDIVLYEKNLALQCYKDSQFSYFNCESVIAVGEVKSTLNSKMLESSISNLKTVKSLKRYYVPPQDGRFYSFRHYLSSLPVHGDSEENFVRNNKIFTFVICHDNECSFNLIQNKINELCENKRELYLDKIVVVTSGFLSFMDPLSRRLQLSVTDSDNSVFIQMDTKYSFNQLVIDLNDFVKNKYTVPICITRYLFPKNTLDYIIKNTSFKKF